MNVEEAIKFLKQLYPNGGHCWLDEQRIEAIGMAIAALEQKGAANEDLNKEIEKEWKRWIKDGEVGYLEVAIHFANWQRSQLMRNAIEVVISDDSTICNAVEVMKLQEKYKGQKVKIAIIKED